MTDYDQAHRVAQQQLAVRVTTRLGAVIAAIPDVREQAAMDTYNRAASQLVAGGQSGAAQLAIGYIALVHPASPGRPPANADRAIRAVRVTGQSPVAYSPILRLWHALEEGADVPFARDAAARYADTLATNDLHAAQRAGLDEAVTASGKHVAGWRKSLAGDACEWCRSIASRVYSSADSVPYHAHDACSVSPVFETDF